MKQHRLFSPVEAVKTVVIFFLIVLMLVLVILLVIGQNSTREETLPQADRMVVYASGVESRYVSGMDTTRVSPYLIAYRSGGGDTNVLHASDSMRKPYEVLYPLLRDLFGSGAVGYALDADTGKALWSACIGMTDLIYVRYNGALPSSVIRAYTYSEEDSETLTAVLDEHADGVSAYVRELLFVPAGLLVQTELLPTVRFTDPTAICAVTCDDRGAVTLFSLTAAAQNVSAPVVTDETRDGDAGDQARMAAVYGGAFDAYITSLSALSTNVQTGVLRASDTAYGTAVTLDGIYSMPQITRTPYDLKQLYGEEQKLLSVLGLLGLRESDTDNYYTDGAGDRIYLNASGHLTVSDTMSVIRYVSLQEGGLDPADYLGYSSIGREYLLSEYLRAADKLLSQLEMSDAIFGGDALDCTLTEVGIGTEENADTLVLTYGYTFRGIPLLDENGEILPAMILHAGGGVITYLELHLCEVGVSADKTYLLPQSVMSEAMALENAQNTAPDTDAEETELPLRPAHLCMVYLCTDPDNYGIFCADWVGLLR